MSNPQRFRDREVVFANGVRGQTIDIPSASPLNYWQAISDPAAMPRITVDGKLFLPTDAKGRLPVVVIVPGSLSIAASHLRHAETLVGMGIAAFVLDPFGARGVTSTVANQAQFSFAASAYDVAATVDVLAKHPALDSTRIGLQGHSRGGSAVLTAVTRLFCETHSASAKGARREELAVRALRGAGLSAADASCVHAATLAFVVGWLQSPATMSSGASGPSATAAFAAAFDLLVGGLSGRAANDEPLSLEAPR